MISEMELQGISNRLRIKYCNWQQSTTPFTKLLRYANIAQISTDIVCVIFELLLLLSLTAMSVCRKRVNNSVCQKTNYSTNS